MPRWCGVFCQPNGYESQRTLFILCLSLTQLSMPASTACKSEKRERELKTVRTHTHTHTHTVIRLSGSMQPLCLMAVTSSSDGRYTTVTFPPPPRGWGQPDNVILRAEPASLPSGRREGETEDGLTTEEATGRSSIFTPQVARAMPADSKATPRAVCV